MLSGGEAAPIGANVRQQHLSRPLAHTGNGVEPGHDLLLIGYMRFNQGPHPGKRLVSIVKMTEMCGQQKALMGHEAPSQSVFECAPLASHPPARQGGQHRDITCARRQCLQHRPCRDAPDIRHDRSELDVRVLQDILEPGERPCPLLHQVAPLAGQIAQLPWRP
jgi:hypothetical protein